MTETLNPDLFGEAEVNDEFERIMTTEFADDKRTLPEVLGEELAKPEGLRPGQIYMTTPIYNHEQKEDPYL